VHWQGQVLRVPEHCSVIGFDRCSGFALYTPSLTTVRQPMQAMGAMAVGIMADGINAVLEKREVSAVHRKMAPELAVREIDPQRGVSAQEGAYRTLSLTPSVFSLTHKSRDKALFMTFLINASF